MAVITNELQLHDYRNAYKMSLTFGEANYEDGYSYLKINVKANDQKVDFLTDKPILNFNVDDITINDKKVWTEVNHGPNSGLNADLLDGLQGEDFKDRLGWYHFNHAFHVIGGPKYVKIATFTPRLVGDPPNFSETGEKPYRGLFEPNEIIVQKKHDDLIKAFIDDTPNNLSSMTNRIANGFSTLDMVSDGVYNSCFRGTVTYLKNSSKTSTLDLHIGIFNDAENKTPTNGWSDTNKFFYISLHDADVPYLQEYDNKQRVDKLDDKGLFESGLLNEEDKIRPTFNQTPVKPRIDSKQKTNTKKVLMNRGYIPPNNPELFYNNPTFPNKTIEPDNYQKRIDNFRLYFIKTDKDTIDGKVVYTHQFDLYMRVDARAEVHIEPYMSSSCQLYNYQTPLNEGQLPSTKYLTPLSVYDKRYSHCKHRHYDYELRIEDIEDEIDKIYRQFPKYVMIAQGRNNADKVLITDEDGNVICVDQNLFLKRCGHEPNKVMVSFDDGCISTSKITRWELEQLENIEENIQIQIDNIKNSISNIINSLSGKFVRLSGDHMKGNLTIQPHADEFDDVHPNEGANFPDGDSSGATFDENAIGLSLKANSTGTDGRIIAEFRDSRNNRYGYVGKNSFPSASGNTDFEIGAYYYDENKESIENRNTKKGKSDLVLSATNGVRVGDARRWARIFIGGENPVTLGKYVSHGDIWIDNKKLPDVYSTEQLKQYINNYRMQGYGALSPSDKQAARQAFNYKFPHGTLIR